MNNADLEEEALYYSVIEPVTLYPDSMIIPKKNWLLLEKYTKMYFDLLEDQATVTASTVPIEIADALAEALNWCRSRMNYEGIHRETFGSMTETPADKALDRYSKFKQENS